MSDHPLCSWCNKNQPSEGRQWCTTCIAAMDDVAPGADVVDSLPPPVSEVASLREQVRERDEEIVRLRADLAGKNAGAVMIVTPEEWDGLHKQVRALTADDAARLNDLRAMHEVAQNVMRHEEREHIRYAILERMETPHPGAALLAEMEALRKRADDADTSAARAANRAEVANSERDVLRQQVATLTAERDDACAMASASETQRRLMEADWDDLAGRCSGAEQEEKVLRARVAELEGTLATEEAERIRCRDGWAACARERDTAQQRARELEDALAAVLDLADNTHPKVLAAMDLLNPWNPKMPEDAT